MSGGQENLAEKKKVSVVVPVYNTAPYLANCIDSLIAQTYRPEEIILVDDGSTDESGNICDEYASRYSHIRVIHKKNEGVSAARNTGMDAARGDYLVFVDSDDAVCRHLLEMYVRYSSDCIVPVCGSSAFKGTPADRQLSVEEQEDGVIYDLHNFMKFFCDDYVNPPWNKLYVLDIVRKYGIQFPKDMDLGEDLIFNLEYLRHAPQNYRAASHPLYCYRLREDESLSSSFRLDLFEIQLRSFEELKKFMADMGVYQGENRRQYVATFWNRLYLTVQVYKKAGKNNEKALAKAKSILRDPVWNRVWSLCKAEKVITKKMILKRLNLFFWRLTI